MHSETKRCLGYWISYFVAAVVLFVMYAASETPVGLLGGIVCIGLGLKYLLDFLRLKKREREHGGEND